MITKLLSRANRHSWLLRIIQIIIIVIPLSFLFRSIFDNWQGIQAFTFQFVPLRFVLALIFLLFAFGLLPVASQQALLQTGYGMNYIAAYRSYHIAQLAKYLPGGLWVIPGRMALFGRYGINVVSSGIGIFIELCLLVISGIIFFTPYIVVYSNEGSFVEMELVFLILPILLIVLHPKVFNPLISRVLLLFGYQEYDIRMSAKTLSKILVIDLFFWLVTGFGFFLLVTSVQPIPLGNWLSVGSSYSMAWVIGFLAFLVPGGLGIREGVLALLLAPILPAPVPALVAVLSRLWWTMAELVSMAIATLVARGGNMNIYSKANKS